MSFSMPGRVFPYLFVKPGMEVQFAVFLLLFVVLVVGKTEGLLGTKNKRLAQTRNNRFGSFLKVADTATLDPTVSTSTTHIKLIWLSGRGPAGNPAVLSSDRGALASF